MFYPNENKNSKKNYQKFLGMIGSLSNLFSDSQIPLLYYRGHENTFCNAFNAENLSRGDLSADAKKYSTGIGLKTFLAQNNKTWQKIAEFNAAKPLLEGLTTKKFVEKISNLRNDRMNLTEKAHNLNNSIYHCVVREIGKYKIYEESMDRIDTKNLKNIEDKGGSYVFNDDKHEYKFYKSKSTLFKKFYTKNCLHEFQVNILKDPLHELENCLSNQNFLSKQHQKIKQTVILPLYGRNKTVWPQSGLNQWNAGGRSRHHDEVYIPIPKRIHDLYPKFFPGRDIHFYLLLPDGEKVEAKVCQDNSKALMTTSNRKLGKLILRDGLNLNEGELVTYEKLQLLGIDSVRIDKINNEEYEINFSASGSYENFLMHFEDNIL